MAAELETTISEISLFKCLLLLYKHRKRNMELAQHVFDVAQKKYEQGVLAAI